MLYQEQQFFRRFITKCAIDNVYFRTRLCASTSAKPFHEAQFASSVSAPCTSAKQQDYRRMYAGVVNRSRAWQRKLPISVMSKLQTRGYSSDSGDGKDRRLEELKGFIMYIPNPTTWLKMQWQTMQLRRKYDPGFSMTDFLKGAKQVSRQPTCQMTLATSQMTVALNAVSRQPTSQMTVALNGSQLVR